MPSTWWLQQRLGRYHKVYRVSANKSVPTTELLYFYHGFSFVFLQVPWFASGSVSRIVVYAGIAWAGMESAGVVCLLTNALLTINLDLLPTFLFRFMTLSTRPRFIHSHSPGPTANATEAVQDSGSQPPAAMRWFLRAVVRLCGRSTVQASATVSRYTFEKSSLHELAMREKPLPKRLYSTWRVGNIVALLAVATCRRRRSGVFCSHEGTHRRLFRLFMYHLSNVLIRSRCLKGLTELCLLILSAGVALLRVSVFER